MGRPSISGAPVLVARLPPARNVERWLDGARLATLAHLLEARRGTDGALHRLDLLPSLRGPLDVGRASESASS